MVLTVAGAYERHHRPRINVSDATAADYGRAVRLWGGLFDCDVSEIGQEHFDKLLNALRQRFKSEETHRKYAASVRAILNTCHSLGLVRAVPTLPPLRAPDRVAPRPTFEQIGLIYKHAAAAEWPRENPGEWWRCWLTLAFFTGMRRCDLLEFSWKCVGPDYVEWVADKTRKHRKVHFAPFDPQGVLKRHLDIARRRNETANSVLSAGRSLRLLRDDGYELISAVCGFHWTPQEIRRSCIDAWQRAGGTDAAALVHGTGIRANVLFKNYVDWRGILRDAVHRFRFPPEFLLPEQREQDNADRAELLRCFDKLSETDRASVLRHAQELV